MGQVAYLRRVGSSAQHFVADWGDRAINAIGKAQTVGGYTADNLVQDVVQSATAATEVWLSMLEGGGDPIVPTISLTASAAALVKGPATASGYTDRAVKAGQPFTYTDPLLLVGQPASPNPINLTVAFPVPWREELTVSIKASKPAPNPTPGIYVGFVIDGSGELLANVTANITP